jgi:hypothetical protein
MHRPSSAVKPSVLSMLRPYAAACDLRRHLRQHRGNVFVRQPVEPVALHAGGADLPRQRHDFGDGRLAAMKARIEAGDLGHAGETLRDRIDRRKVVRLVKWSQRDQCPQLLQHLRRHERRTGERRAAVDDAVSHTDHSRTFVPGTEPPCERLQRRAPVASGRALELLVGHAGAAAVFSGESRRGPDPFDLAPRFETPRAALGSLVDAELQAR